MKSIKILYAEDEPFLGRIVKESLESRGLVVEMATDGSQVLPLLERLQPDICVLDIMMPVRDGYSLAKEIRSRYPKLPILFLTARTQVEDVLKGFESGGNDYLKKPFSMEELIVRIHNLLALAGNATEAIPKEEIRLGEFLFVPGRYELRQGETTRTLSHRETSLLAVLAAHQNDTVSRKEILKTVWGDDSYFNSRNLDVYINKLREYLNADPTVEIKTIKGVGYLFSVG
jgi:DNA-binding response OmpR family regulator